MNATQQAAMDRAGETGEVILRTQPLATACTGVGGEQSIRDALAARPTFGAWTSEEIAPDDPEWGACEVWAGSEVVATHVFGRENAAFIAACNPEAIIALLAEIDNLRAALTKNSEATP